jgi:predicted lipoprotein with Yx(FWY)xxD motif
MKAIRITLVAVALCALAACSSDSGTPAAPDTSTSLSTTPSEATESSSIGASASESESESASGGPVATVSLHTAKVKGVGTVLVEEDGITVYLFTNDTGSTSTCTGSCAATWPPLITAGQPTAGKGADDGKLGTTTSDGGEQVTYDGHPLYLYSGDKRTGQANGQGIGGVWFAVTADGNPAGQADDNGGGNSGNG